MFDWFYFVHFQLKGISTLQKKNYIKVGMFFEVKFQINTFVFLNYVLDRHSDKNFCNTCQTAYVSNSHVTETVGAIQSCD